LAEKWKSKAKIGVHGVLRGKLVRKAAKVYGDISYVHSRETAKVPGIKL
jgi:hypothetical protein